MAMFVVGTSAIDTCSIKFIEECVGQYKIALKKNLGHCERQAVMVNCFNKDDTCGDSDVTILAFRLWMLVLAGADFKMGYCHHQTNGTTLLAFETLVDDALKQRANTETLAETIRNLQQSIDALRTSSLTPSNEETQKKIHRDCLADYKAKVESTRSICGPAEEMTACYKSKGEAEGVFHGLISQLHSTLKIVVPLVTRVLEKSLPLVWNILVECIYDKDGKGNKVRVRSNYREMADASWPKFGGWIAFTTQVIEMVLIAYLYLVYAASLLEGLNPTTPIPLRIWMLIVAVVGLPTIFFKHYSQVAWISLASIVALTIAICIILAILDITILDITTIDITTIDIKTIHIKRLDIRTIDITILDIMTIDITTSEITILDIATIDIKCLEIRTIELSLFLYIVNWL
ncbi:predicted protein [Nematostella vectensis]|uniref:Amino acid transporter transmembrane domain-containing protein n=1 Tax=Nematostella vectensis TaxID=45351 RepID=A7RF76_NEMVE|nr:predicted protein [Nematostella vectensis]|eukprot:XP_001641970.1 predicted protein [Nematostella vectensis]